MKKFFLILLLILVIVITSVLTLTDVYPSKNTFNYECSRARHGDLDTKSKLADKFEVKNYLSTNFSDVKFAKVLYEVSVIEDIRKMTLPSNFILKNSAGCGEVKIIRNGKIISKKGDIEGPATIDNLINNAYDIKKSKPLFLYKLGSFLLPYTDFSEPHYDIIKPKLFIEEYLEDVGELRIYYKKNKILVIEYLDHYYTDDWKKVPNIFNGEIINTNHSRPSCLDRILRFGDEFTKKNTFPVLRLDLYLKNDGSDFYFGEFTFCPSNCVQKFTSEFQNSFKQLV